MVRRPDSTLQEQDQFLAFCRANDVRPMIVGQHNYTGDVESVAKLGAELGRE